MANLGRMSPAQIAAYQRKNPLSATVLPELIPGTKCYLGAGRPEQIGAVVEVIEYPAGYEGGKDVCYVKDFPGEKFFTDRRNLRPTVDPRYAEQRAKLEKFDPYKDMVEFYDSLTDAQKAELKAQGIC